MTVGIAMGISTMAAAALGNTISDVAGVGLGGFIESMATKLGLPQAKLSRCVDELRVSSWCPLSEHESHVCIAARISRLDNVGIAVRQTCL